MDTGGLTDSEEDRPYAEGLVRAWETPAAGLFELQDENPWHPTDFIYRSCEAFVAASSALGEFRNDVRALGSLDSDLALAEELEDPGQTAQVLNYAIALMTPFINEDSDSVFWLMQEHKIYTRYFGAIVGALERLDPMATARAWGWTNLVAVWNADRLAHHDFGQGTTQTLIAADKGRSRDQPDPLQLLRCFFPTEPNTAQVLFAGAGCDLKGWYARLKLYPELLTQGTELDDVADVVVYHNNHFTLGEKYRLSIGWPEPD